MFYSKEEIRKMINSYKVTTNEKGQISVQYIDADEAEEPSWIDIYECAEKNSRAYSPLKALYNAIFKKAQTPVQAPCTAMFDWTSLSA